mgnify:CR=1 FL=1
MMEPLPIRTDSFSYVRNKYFNGGLNSGDEVTFYNVVVLEKMGNVMLQLGAEEKTKMLGNLDTIVDESGILDALVDKSGNLVEMDGEARLTVRGIYFNSNPKQPTLNFPEQFESTEYLEITGMEWYN